MTSRRTAAAVFALAIAPRLAHADAPPAAKVPTAPAPTWQAAPAPLPGPPSADADSALEHARAAYEYGEMEDVVESARLVAEGRLSATPAQRAQALRYLGIGLFLTGRREGAETAFFDLLRVRPQSRLDPTTTRPDVVAFFEDVRRRHAAAIDEAARSRPGKSLTLAFLPPAGQFQAGHKARGITLATIEGLSLATAIGTYAQLRAWDNPTHDFGTHADSARTLKAVNNVSVVVFAAAIVVGIVDGVSSYYAVEPDEQQPSQSLASMFGRGYRF
ncbi:MAG TPA: hypothetical protein VHJ20_01835 [Polyangia bacterium]|nr:hypothetical protein [Polyangia bacterium]